MIKPSNDVVAAGVAVAVAFGVFSNEQARSIAPQLTTRERLWCFTARELMLVEQQVRRMRVHGSGPACSEPSTQGATHS